jgi:hypothetical protein
LNSPGDRSVAFARENFHDERIGIFPQQRAKVALQMRHIRYE